MGRTIGKPKSETLDARTWGDLLTTEGENITLIESQIQRPFVWDYNLISQYIESHIRLCKDNIIGPQKGVRERECFNILTISDLPNREIPTRSVIDGGQRSEETFAELLAVTKIEAEEASVINDELEKMFNNRFILSNKLVFQTTFIDDEIEKTYNEILSDPDFFNFKKHKESAIKSAFNKENEERKFSDLVRLNYLLIRSYLESEDLSADKLYETITKDCYVLIRPCEAKDKTEVFVEENKDRVGMKDIDMYRVLMLRGDSGGENDKLYNNLKGKVAEIKENGYFRDTKNGKTVLEFILKTAVQVIERKETVYDLFTLEAQKNGLVNQINDGILDTVEKVTVFLEKANDIADFILNDSMAYKPNDFYTDYYLFADGRNTNRLWWHHLLPLYILDREIEDKEKKEYVFMYLLKSWLVYNLKYTKSSSIQYYQKFLYKVSYELLRANDTPIGNLIAKLKVLYTYPKTFGDFLNKKDGVTSAIDGLDFKGQGHIVAIIGVFATMEYEIYRILGEKKDSLYRYFNTGEEKEYGEKKKVPKWSLDHTLPQKCFDDETDETKRKLFHSVGNLAILERVLNSSKRDDITKNYEAYSKSVFYTTSLMCVSMSQIRNEDLKKIKEEMCFIRDLSEEDINTFDEQMAKRKKDCITQYLANYLLDI